MRTLLIRFFTENWQRKLASLILSIIIWFVVHHSITQTKTFENIPVSIRNLPVGKTVEGMQADGRLSHRITLQITGNKHALESINNTDLEIAIDARKNKDEWVEKITKNNLISKSDSLDITRDIAQISNLDFLVKLSPLIEEKVPVIISAPIGEAPKSYQFLDIWPYQLSLSVQGPEKVVKKLKSRGLKLTFNLNEITKNELDALYQKKSSQTDEEIHYFVPDSWKKILIPSLSNQPIAINDPAANGLRIDFAKRNLVSLNAPIPVAVFFPPKQAQGKNPNLFVIECNNFIENKNGIKMITKPLYAKGVSRLFVELIRDHIQLLIIPSLKENQLLWNVQFIYPHELENQYVAKVMSQAEDGEVNHLNPQIRESYLRNRFRNYMNKFRLYTPDDKKLNLKIALNDQKIAVVPTEK